MPFYEEDKNAFLNADILFCLLGTGGSDLCWKNKFQANLIKELKERFPGCIVMKSDSSYIQEYHFILHNDKWASLECSPENKKREVLNELQQTFES